MKVVVAGGTGVIGRVVVERARRRGHDVTVLSRGSGHDLRRSRAGLDDALAGAHAVLDLTNVVTLSARAAVRFTTTVTRRLLTAGARAGVGHHVALSVVGIDDIDAGYYAGKLAQERMVATGPVPWTIQRAAQVHEFAEQVLGFASVGSVSLVPRILARPVAAHTVAERLVDLAEAGPQGRVPDLVGPRDEVVADLARQWLAATGRRGRVVQVSLPGAYGTGIASGALRGRPGATGEGPEFREWLARR
ncbi:NAD(P)H-binding protein [Cytobacillus oceanisediminis]